jgi:sortase A
MDANAESATRDAAAVTDESGGPAAAGAPGEAPGVRRPARGRSRWRRRLGDLLLIVGGLVLAYPLWSAGFTLAEQGRLASAYTSRDAAFARTVAGASARARHVPTRLLVARLAQRYGAQLRPGDPIGRLLIPRLGLDYVIQQGASGRATLSSTSDAALLRNGPVHYAITPLPGAGEPFAVAGHRTTYGAPFYKLAKLRRGDAIEVATPYARFYYTLARSTVVLPGDTGVLADHGYALVLTTCTPFYSASHRLIVWGRLVREVVRPGVSKPSG